jgi:hypothetical protein
MRFVIAILVATTLSCGEEFADDCDAPEACKEAAKKFYECCTDEAGGLDWEKSADRCEGAQRLGRSVTTSRCQQIANSSCTTVIAECSFAPR